MPNTKRLENNQPGEKYKVQKIQLKHQTRLIDICDQILRDPDVNREHLFDYVQELRKELSKL